MSIALVVTAGFGNGTLAGTVKGVVLRGYEIGSAIITPGLTFGVIGSIDSSGMGVRGIMDSVGISAAGVIANSFGLSATIDASGFSVQGTIDPIGIGVIGTID